MSPLASNDNYNITYVWFPPSSNCEGHKVVEKAVEKIKSTIMQRDTEATFTPDELEKLLSSGLCSLLLDEVDDNVEARKYYSKFTNAFSQSIVQVVLPSLRDKEFLSSFPELKMWWKKYKKMADILVPFFLPLVTAHPHLTNGLRFEFVPIKIFCDMVLDSLWAPAPEIVTLMIRQERDGLQINQGLLKEIVHFAMEVEEFGNRPYFGDVERAILEDTATYTNMLSLKWLSANYSFGGYLQKVEQLLQEEKKQKGRYLPRSTIDKLLKVAGNELYDKVSREVAALIPENGVGIRRRIR